MERAHAVSSARDNGSRAFLDGEHRRSLDRAVLGRDDQREGLLRGIRALPPRFVKSQAAGRDEEDCRAYLFVVVARAASHAREREEAALRILASRAVTTGA
jgi:hypothetical protein